MGTPKRSYTTLAGSVALLLATGGMLLIPLHSGNPVIQPGRTLESAVPVPSHVASILRRACKDCHSSETRWPWYSRVAPVSWVVAHDVTRGRRSLNFSEWALESAATPSRAIGSLAAACSATRSGDMPPQSYRWLHPEARLKPEEVEALCAWTSTTARSIKTRHRRRTTQASLIVPEILNR